MSKLSCAKVIRRGEGKAKITVHMGTCGIAAGSRKIMTAVIDEVEKKGMEDLIVATAGCAGLCSREPMVTVEVAGQPPVKYVDLTDEKVREVLHKHILNGEIVKEYALALGSERTG